MNDPRGSIWRRCDFHVHTPLSALENNFSPDFDEYVKTLFKKAIEKKVFIIGITDYFTIDGYKMIRNEYLENESKLKTLFNEDEISQIKKILVLPNIEFRLNKIIQVIKPSGSTTKTESGRVNFHVIFSDDLSVKEIEENFLHNIEFTYEADPDQPDKRKKLKTDNLTTLGKRLKAEQPDIEGADLKVGMTHAVVNDEELVKLLTGNNDFENKYLIVVPSDEDLSVIQWKSQDGLTRKILLSRSHALFSSNPKTIAFGLGEKADNQDTFLKEFKTLKPCIWGSDAHDNEKLFEPDMERYSWIKADATFEGIRQILFEPKDRVYIGKYPELGHRIQTAKNCYMTSLTVTKQEKYDGRNGEWFNNFTLPIGYELTAIIGNKGKGKSAIADILALLGNAHVDREDFSFLNDDKFCQKGYADHFTATLKWYDGTTNIRGLSERVDVSSVERLKYLPQSYLEKLCNNEDGKFQEEINKVVFSRLEDSEKLGRRSFLELREYKSQLIEQKIAELKNSLELINKGITTLETKTVDSYKQSLDNKLIARKQELTTHDNDKAKIKIVANPTENESLSQEQKSKASVLKNLNEEIAGLEKGIEEQTQKLGISRLRLSELELIRDEITSMKARFDAWQEEKTLHYAGFGLDIRQIASFTADTTKVEQLIEAEKNLIQRFVDSLSEDLPIGNVVTVESLVRQLSDKIKQRESIGTELEKPFKEWQEYQQLLKEWEIKRKEIVGTKDNQDSITFLAIELSYLADGLKNDLIKLGESRDGLIRQVFALKQEIQAIYNKSKAAISDVLQLYSKEQNITIETAFKLDRLFYSRVFDYVNRYGNFYQNGDEALRHFVHEYNFDDIEQIISFINNFLSLDIRFKEGRKTDFYNYLSSLDYIDPEYDLRLNGKSLAQLSPGEKGGLLLIFYLVLDKDNKPLIIDQPEDNLDNQSVAEILVPYIKSAKSKRQIIMVTHNPNLAIVADAEQIIYMDIDKENHYVVSSVSGGIENPVINNHIVNILEGRMKAFNNRRIKYRKEIKAT